MKFANAFQKFNPFNKPVVEEKSVIRITAVEESTRGGVQKAFMPKFLYKPPYGYPRFSDMPYIRGLAATPYVDMCIQTILDELCAIPWDIIVNPDLEDVEEDPEEVYHIKNFFENPNTNDEDFCEVFIERPWRDVLEVNSGVMIKVFNMAGELAELVVRDGATFTKNPDIHGMYTYREDILIPKIILDPSGDAAYTNVGRNVIRQNHGYGPAQGQGGNSAPFSNFGTANPTVPQTNPDSIGHTDGVGYGTGNPYNLTYMTSTFAREYAAYFQYGWTAGPVPVPFGKQEIIWIERMIRTDDHYAMSPVMLLAKVLQTLKYYIEGDYEYFNDNNLPKGILGVLEASSSELEEFREQWKDAQYKKDDFGNWKRAVHRVPIVNAKPEFTRFEFTASEMQALEKQKWWTKVVWACFGVTGVELGFTEDAKGSANMIVQTKVFKKKAINPAVRKLSSKYNKNIIPHFGYTALISKGKKNVEVQKYVFDFLTEDIDEETAKAELNKILIENGEKTPNEIRKAKGDPLVDWGDDPPSKIAGGGTNFNMFNPNDNSQGDPQSSFEGSQKRAKGEKENISKTPKTGNPAANNPASGSKQNQNTQKSVSKETIERGTAIEAAEHPSFTEDQARQVAIDHLHKDPGAYPEEKACDKNYKAAAADNNPLVLQENELPSSPKRLEQGMTFLIDGIKKEIMNLIDIEGSNEEVNIKSLGDVIKKIPGLFKLTGIKMLADAIIRGSYMHGLEEVEVELDRNFEPNQRAIAFLEDYTFENIKGMQDDMQNKLRQELQRGFMNGEGITDMKNRVKKVMKISAVRAKMIARTEANRAANAGRLKGYQESGLKGKKIYRAVIDKNTSAICRRLNGQEVGLNEMFHDKVTGWKGMHPPAHPNCRSDIEFEIDKDQGDGKE